MASNRGSLDDKPETMHLRATSGSSSVSLPNACEMPKSAPAFQLAQSSPKASLNLNKRTQVLRMSRRGERTENIAASLSLPRREVELLLKIHGLVLSASTEKPAAKAAG